MEKKRKKRSLTLLEMMVVIFLIGLIGSVVGVNMKKSMDKAKEFRTQNAKRQIEEIIGLEIAKGDKTPEEILSNPEYYIRQSGLVRDAKKTLADGWGKPFIIADDEDKGEVVVTRTGKAQPTSDDPTHEKN